MDYEALKKSQEEDDRVLLLGESVSGVVVDLRVVAGAMSRVGETATITKLTAPELSQAFNEAEAAIGRIVDRAKSASDAADCRTKAVWDRLLLEFAPGEVEARKVRDTQDHRNAVVRLHPEYVEAQDQQRHAKWVVANLLNKQERVHRANRLAMVVAGEKEYYRGSGAGGGTQPQGTFGQTRY